MPLAWNDKRRFSLTQDTTNLATLLLQERFPRLANPGPTLEGILAQSFPNLLVPAQPPNHKSSSWAITYAFDQYLWQPDGNLHHGIGVFFGFGASDGNPNPIQYSLLGGLGGCRAVLTTPLALPSRGHRSAARFCRFCASSSISACKRKTRSRCTTTSRSPNSSTSPPTFRSSTSPKKSPERVGPARACRYGRHRRRPYAHPLLDEISFGLPGDIGFDHLGRIDDPVEGRLAFDPEFGHAALHVSTGKNRAGAITFLPACRSYACFPRPIWSLISPI